MPLARDLHREGELSLADEAAQLMAAARVPRQTGEAGAPRTRPGTAAESRAEAVATALEAALSLRAAALHASTPMVRTLAVRMAARLGLDEDQQRLAGLSARVRDIGMLGLSEDIVRSSTMLSPEQWQLINQHPIIGAELLAGLPDLRDAAPIVRAHHERWDGDGYPDGVAGELIPVLSRVISTADAFVALVTDRPHRRAIEPDVALEHLAEQSGRHLDPRTVDALLATLKRAPGRTSAAARGSAPTESATAAGGAAMAAQAQPQPPQPAAGRQRTGGVGAGLGEALRGLDRLPAFVPSWERAMEAVGQDGALVGAIESNMALTMAVLRAAQSERPDGFSNVPDAIHALGQTRTAQVIESVPQVPFPWQTAEEEMLFALRVHGQAVARAAQRLAEEVAFHQRDDLIAAAILHDVGKLVLTRARGNAGDDNERRQTPEQRVERERRDLRLDHATIGSLLIERWGLPERLSGVVARHHRATRGDDLATLLRLADMVARHAHADPVDRRIMLRLSTACGVSAQALREIMFDLPHPGSQRRRAERSPLSRRETDALRHLAAGKLYKEIAAEMGVGTSTIRSHLHNIYGKLGVEDRAQAVLRASEMGWI